MASQQVKKFPRNLRNPEIDYSIYKGLHSRPSETVSSGPFCRVVTR